jgi:hypothetical protein
VTVGDGYFSFARKEDEIRREAELDGIYVIRTSGSQLQEPDSGGGSIPLSQADLEQC